MSEAPPHNPANPANLSHLDHLNAAQLRRLLVEQLTRQKLGLYWESDSLDRDRALNENVVLPRVVLPRVVPLRFAFRLKMIFRKSFAPTFRTGRHVCDPLQLEWLKIIRLHSLTALSEMVTTP